jgi:3-deoxy-D-manno-octulosonate 8-phosphate phosphatase (KDO 8-P phosphatase)
VTDDAVRDAFDPVRLARIRLLIADVDGVMTDGSIVVHADGSETKIFNVRDGSAVKWLNRHGLRTAILSGRPCAAVEHRARDLGFHHCLTGQKNKLPAYRQLVDAESLADADVCYVGDDLPDIPPMRHAGVPVAVADAADETKSYAAYITHAAGGRGAIREIAEMILKAQGKWDTLMQRYIG